MGAAPAIKAAIAIGSIRERGKGGAPFTPSNELPLLAALLLYGPSCKS